MGRLFLEMNSVGKTTPLLLEREQIRQKVMLPLHNFIGCLQERGLHFAGARGGANAKGADVGYSNLANFWRFGACL